LRTVKSQLKEIGKKFLNSSLIASLLASVRVGAFVRVHRDKDSDFIFVWQGEVTVQDRCDFNPLHCNANLDLFFFSYTPKRGDTVVLVGVENGPEVPMICRLVGDDGCVVAVEPTPSCIRRLRKLKALLNLSQLLIVECAAGDTKGNALLTLGESDMSNSLSGCSGVVDAARVGVVVQVSPLPTILKSLGIGTVDYCKINTEGAELPVLAGVSSVSESHIEIRNFCISAHDFLGPRTRSFDQTIEWLSAHGYRVHYFPYSPYPWRNYYLYGSR
jgi:FkbM family methyltransferase